MDSFMNAPIRPQPQPQTEQVSLQAVHECFVDVEAYSGGRILVDMQYAKAGVAGATNKAYLRETVAKKMMQAAQLLPQDYRLQVLDAWRPYEVQLNLYNSYREQILRKAPQALSEDELKKMVCRFVSFPDKSKAISFVHSSGGAVDLTIIGQDGKPLDMGSDFDEFKENSHTAWYEKQSSDTQIRDNRRLLHNAMCSCGFTNYPEEWWHYDYGDSFWSSYTAEPVKYVSVFDIKEVLHYE